MFTDTIGTRYGNYSLEIRATDKGLEPNSASAIYNVNIQPSSSHLTFLQCFHQICNHCSLATFSIAGVCHWLQWPPSQVCESAQEFHNPCGRGWRGELVGDFEDTLTCRKRILSDLPRLRLEPLWLRFVQLTRISATTEQSGYHCLHSHS